MASPSTSTETADRLGRKRARVSFVLAVLFLGQQAAYFDDGPLRPAEHLRIGAWVVMAAVLLIMLVTGGAWLRGREVRALLNDESTRANRAEALSAGFVAGTGSAIVLYPLVGVLALGPLEVLHIVVSFALATALVRFGMLERRAFG